MVKYNQKSGSHEQHIAKGALVNVLGTIGKASFPALFILVARLYGPELLGIFFMVYKILDIISSITVSGINDGMIMFLSRDIDNHRETEKRLYTIMANGFVLSLSIATIVIGAAYFGGLNFIKAWYPQPQVIDALKFLVWSIPFIFIPILVVSATKSLMIMKYDALIMGFLKPFSLTLLAVVFYFFSPGLPSLLQSYFCTMVIMTVVSLYVFGKHFSFRTLFNHIIRFRIFKPLIFFAVPQNINITFTTFITNIDILMLGYFNISPEMIGFYGMGAQIVRNLREVKLAFSGAYAPIIARLHTLKDSAKMSETFSMVSRWTSSIGFPIALLIAIFRDELIQIFHPSYTHDTTFMVVLLVPPLISCTIGLSANILVMTGHSGWNLFNSVFSTTLNGILNWFLIQKFGLTGAAIASAIASTTVTLIIMAEIKVKTGTTLLLRRIYKPYLAIAPSIAAVFTLSIYLPDTFTAKIVLSVAALAVYAVAWFVLGTEEEDRNMFFRRKSKRAATE